MKNKFITPPFFTGLFAQKVLTMLSLIVLFALGANGQSIMQPTDEDTTWVATYTLDNVSGATVSGAKLYSYGIFNHTHQSPDGILCGRTENIQHKKYWMKQGALMSSTTGSISTHDIIKIDANGNLTSGGTSPSYYTHRSKQLIIQTVKVSPDTVLYLMQDEYIATSHKRVWISIANGAPVEVFPGMSSTAEITSVRYHGGGKILLTGSFSASDFGQTGSWVNYLLYKLNGVGPTAYEGWNQGTQTNYSGYAYPADGIVNSTVFPIIQGLPWGGSRLVFGKVGVNGYYPVTPTTLDAQAIESVNVFSETNIYIYCTGSVFNDTKLMHWNGINWSAVPNSPIQSFSGGYNSWLDYNPTTGRLWSNFINLNVASGPSSAVLNTAQEMIDIDNYQGGMWEVNGHFFKWSNIGGAKLLTMEDLTPPTPTVISIPTAEQVFPAGTTFVTFSGNGNACIGDTLKLYPNGSSTPVKTDVADNNGTWGMILTGLTPGYYTYKITRTDPHGNENMGTMVSFTISAGPTAVSTTIAEATITVSQYGDNISINSDKELIGYIVTSAGGSIVSVEHVTKKQFEFSTSGLATGVYYITMYDADNRRYVKSIVKN